MKIMIFYIITLIPYLIYLKFKYKKDLHALQMNSYRFERYMKWFRENRKENFRMRDLLPLLPIAVFLFEVDIITKIFIYKGIWAAIYSYLYIKREKFEAKKPLVFTARVKRIYTTSWVITSLILLLIFWSYKLTLNIDMNKFYIVIIAETILLSELTFASFAVVLKSNFMLKPVEKAIQYKFYKKARKKLDNINGIRKIGITGSYGKTSTKMIVSSILEEKFNLCKTPKSYNTLMGVVRAINENLLKTDKVFVAEMGAKQTGDIKEICDLVKPNIAILTSIGPQHLETFKTIENVKKTKWELVDSLEEDGLAVLNVDNKYIKEAIEETKDTRKGELITYSMETKDVDYYGEIISITDEGTIFKVKTKDAETEFKTVLLGQHNIYNILASIAIAEKLGMSLVEIKRAVLQVKPVEHRLELKKSASGITILDDAFNSNPSGSKMALEVLKRMNGNKKIVITPGMIELGDKQYELNKKLGEYCANAADFVILVGKEQTKPIYNGLKEANYPESKIYIASGLDDANNKMQQIVEKGDVVLYENDLLVDK